MNKARSAQFSCALLIGLMLPSWALAQSNITGTVRDQSGAVVPNATVVAASPALIEQSRTVTTNGEGQFNIVDVRPGTYSVTFTASGFQKLQRDNVEVRSGESLPMFVDLTIGATGETVIVRDEVPVVDTANASNHQVLTRDVQDAIPVPRNMQAMGALSPGIQLRNGAGANPDVGGSQQMEQTYLIGHGSLANQTTVLLDGLVINSGYLDGTIQNYVDNGIIQEATYQTSGVTADVAAGGVLVNQIPRDGSNTIHGDFFGSYTGQGSPWQANNLTQGLINRFNTFGVRPSVNGIIHIQDFDNTVGGPIIKNKLWFLASYRYQSTFDTPAGVFNKDGTPGIEDQYIKQGVLRLSWQISSKDKFSATYDRIQKFKGHELSGLALTPSDREVSASRRGPPNYYVAQAKWTRVQSPNMLFDAGFSTDVIFFSVIYQPGQEKVPFTPDWYKFASHVDNVLAIRSVAPPLQSYLIPDRRNFSGQMTWIKGSHIMKFGAQDGFGKNNRVSSMNADLYQNYANGVPQNVTVFNTPIAVRQAVNADIGLYAMDAWHVGRLTLNYGLRWEYQKSTINASAVQAGRFVPARNFSEISCATIKGLGCWKTFSPRIGGVYDISGKGRTVVKASFGKYNIPQMTGYIANFNPMALFSETRSWTDTNKDDIAQDSEIGPGAPTFGQATSIPKNDPNFKREYALQYSAGLTHQVRSGVGVSFNWFHRTAHNQAVLVNRAVDSVKDWIPFNVTNPYDGTPITAYTISAAARARPVDNYVTNADPDKRKSSYTGFETAATFRLPNNGRLMANWTMDRNVETACDMPIGTSLIGLLQIYGNNIINTSYNDPNSLRYCDERGKIPFRHEGKIIASIPLKWGIQASAIMLSSPAFEKYVNWDITAAARYSADCKGCAAGQLIVPAGVTIPTGSIRVALSEPGTRYSDRLNQLDLGIKRTFKFKERYTLQGQVDFFNVMNSNTNLVETQNLGVGAQTATAVPGSYSIAPFTLGGPGGRPVSVLQARLMRIGFQFHF